MPRRRSSTPSNNPSGEDVALPPETSRAFPLDALRQAQQSTTSSSPASMNNPTPAADLAYLGSIVRTSPATPLQKKGVEFILSKKGRCLIADEMGVGKTLQALYGMWFFKAEFPLLVVCPSTLRGVWKSESEQWLDGFPINGAGGLRFKTADHVQIIKTGKDVFQPGKLIYVISYTLLAPARNSPRDFSKLPDSTVAQNRVRQELFGRGRFAEHVPRDFRCVILDESHYIKGADSNRTQSVLDVCRRATRCLLLSGTPTPNHPLELVPQLQALYPDLRDHQIVNGRTFLDYFKSRYCLIEQRQVALNPYTGQPIIREVVVGGQRQEELGRFLHNEVMIRRTKEEALPDLPGLRRTKIMLDGLKTIKKDARVSETLRDRIERDEGLAGLGAEDLGALKMNFKETGLAKAKGAAEYVCEFLSETTNFKEKVVIFGHHTAVLEVVEKKVAALFESENKKKGRTGPALDVACHYGPHCNGGAIDRKVSDFQRDDVAAGTNNRTTLVLILGITAGNVGLTLTRSATVIFAELFWVPASILQAEARVHRKGQKRLANIYYLMHAGHESLDGAIFGVLQRKYGGARELLDHGDGSDQLEVAGFQRWAVAEEDSSEEEEPEDSSEEEPERKRTKK